MSSTVSCSSAAQSVSVSRRMPAQIFATPTGWTMKSSPDLRRWSAWCSQAKTNAVLDALAVDLDGRVVGVLLDDREEVAEQPALGLGEVGALDRGVGVGALDAVDRPRCDRRVTRRAGRRAAARAAPVRGSVMPPGSRVAQPSCGRPRVGAARRGTAGERSSAVRSSAGGRHAPAVGVERGRGRARRGPRPDGRPSAPTAAARRRRAAAPRARSPRSAARVAQGPVQRGERPGAGRSSRSWHLHREA